MRSERFAEHGAETSVAGPKTLTPAVFTFETTGSGFDVLVAEETRCILVLADCCALFGALPLRRLAARWHLERSPLRLEPHKEKNHG